MIHVNMPPVSVATALKRSRKPWAREERVGLNRHPKDFNSTAYTLSRLSIASVDVQVRLG